MDNVDLNFGLGSELFDGLDRFFALASARGVKSVTLDCITRRVNVEMHQPLENDDDACQSEDYYHKLLDTHGMEDRAKAIYGGWKKRQFTKPTLTLYDRFLGKQLEMVLNSDFLVLDEWSPADDFAQYAGELERWGLAQKSHELKYCLLRQLLVLDGDRLRVNESVTGSYLLARKDKLTRDGIRCFFCFVQLLQVVYDDMDRTMLDAVPVLSDMRQGILVRLLSYTKKGDWIAPASMLGVQKFIKTVLGVGDTRLNDDNARMSSELWKMLEQGRGDRVQLVMQNLIGYFVSRGWLQKGSPALNRAFFGTEDGYPNIDKGNPQSKGMSGAFRKVLPLLDGLS